MLDDRGKGILLTTVTPYAAFDGMTRDLASGLRDAGIEAEALTLDEIEADRARFVERLRAWRPRPPRFVLAWNAKLHIRCDGASIHDAFGVPLVAPLLDHPAYHHEHLTQMPRNAIIGMVDRRHLGYLAEGAFAPFATVFFPHGGPPPEPRPKPMAARKTRVLFCGTIGPRPDLRQASAALAPPGSASKTDALADRLAERCLAEATDPARAAKEEFGNTGIDVTGPALAAPFARLVTEICTLITHDWRVHLLNAVRRAPVVVRGTIDASVVIRNRGNLSHAGLLPFRDLPEAFADTRLVLNVTPKFRDGSHERIFYGMAAGAVIATDANAYLAESFSAGRDVIYLPSTPEAAGALIDEVAMDDGALQSLADNAAAIYAGGHTWAHRARVLIDALATLKAPA